MPAPPILMTAPVQQDVRCFLLFAAAVNEAGKANNEKAREATSLAEVIQEMLVATTSERQGRIIDKDGGGASMEKKKQEGYF